MGPKKTKDAYFILSDIRCNCPGTTEVYRGKHLHPPIFGTPRERGGML